MHDDDRRLLAYLIGGVLLLGLLVFGGIDLLILLGVTLDY